MLLLSLLKRCESERKTWVWIYRHRCETGVGGGCVKRRKCPYAARSELDSSLVHFPFLVSTWTVQIGSGKWISAAWHGGVGGCECGMRCVNHECRGHHIYTTTTLHVPLCGPHYLPPKPNQGIRCWWVYCIWLP